MFSVALFKLTISDHTRQHYLMRGRMVDLKICQIIADESYFLARDTERIFLAANL